MAKAPKFFAHEQMMDAWEKEGRVRVEELSLKGLDSDPDFQARVLPRGLDVDHVRELGRHLLDTGHLAPIIVFEIDGRFIIVDGHHRKGSYDKAGRKSILARVVRGLTKQQAIEYATCCNQANTSMKTTAEDKRKACFLLLSNGWLGRSTAELGKHVGASSTSSTKWIAEFCESTGAKRPDRVPDSLGRMSKTSIRNGSQSGRAIFNTGRMFGAAVNGKTIYGKTKEEVEEKISTIQSTEAASRATLSDTGKISMHLTRKASAAYRGENVGCLNQMAVGTCRGRLVSPCPGYESGPRGIRPLVEAVGRAVVAGEILRLPRRVVLTPIPAKSYADLVSAATNVGVEIMSLDEFTEILLAENGPPAKSDEERISEVVAKLMTENSGKTPAKQVESEVKKLGIKWNPVKAFKIRSRLGLEATREAHPTWGHQWYWMAPAARA